MVTNRFIRRLIFSVAVSLTIAVIIHFRFHIYFAFLRAITPKTKSPDNDKIIEKLHPIFALKVARFVRELERKGHTVKLTSGLRSWEKQAELYLAGITPVPAGGSFHNYGFAIDMNVDNLTMSSSYNAWLPVAEIGIGKYGFRWGGNFSNNWDKVHFDDGNDFTIEQLKKAYQSDKVVNNEYVKVF